MRTKDQLLLEEAYQKIYLKENYKDGEEEADYDQYKHSGVPYGNTSEDYGDFSENEEEGEYVPEEIDISEDVPNGGIEIERNTPLSFFEKGVPKNVFFKGVYPNQIKKLYFDGYNFTQGTILNNKTQETFSDQKISLKTLNHYFHLWRNEKPHASNTISSLAASSTFDPTGTPEADEDRYLDSGYEDRYSESFIHGIQPIVEAKKKVNPWAIEKSIENKTGKKFGKKHKEEIIKGIKKSAKKSGKKITSDKVKPKKK